MQRLATLTIVLLPAITFAQVPAHCAFTLGYGSIKGESNAEPQRMVPHWFTASGRVVMAINGTKLVAKLYDATANGEHTHTLTANLSRAPGKVVTFKTGINGSLKNLFSDAGDDALSGTFEVTVDPHGHGKPILQSLVLHNAHTFVALSCYGKSAA